jgi:uncharacterized membrane protein (Fun14 family)
VAFFIQLSLSIFGYAVKTDWIQILLFLVFFFVLSKFLIEKIIGTAFNIEEFVEQFNLQKSYIEHQFVLYSCECNTFYYDSISKKYSYCIYIYYSVY